MKTAQTRFPRGESGVRVGAQPAAEALTFRNGGRAMLSSAEAAEKSRLERTIKRGLKAFNEVAAALMVVRDKRYYRDTHDTFEDYCREIFGVTGRRMRQICDAAAVVAGLGEGRGERGESTLPLPATESQARPLVGLPEEKRREAWDTAVKAAAARNSKVTAKDVETAVNFWSDSKEERAARLSPVEMPEAPLWPEPNNFGRYPEEPAEKIQIKDCPDARAEILLLQIGAHTWISVARWQGAGAVVWPELRADSQFPTRESALAAAAQKMARGAISFLRADLGTASALQRARGLAAWANQQAQSVGYSPVMIPPPPAPREGTRPTGAQGTKGGGRSEPEPIVLKTAKRMFDVGMNAAGLSRTWNAAGTETQIAMLAISKWHLGEIASLAAINHRGTEAQRKKV